MLAIVAGCGRSVLDLPTDTEASTGVPVTTDGGDDPSPVTSADADSSGGAPTDGPGESEGDEGDSSEGPALGCGNGIVEDDEACDDGNDVAADGCNPGCIRSGSVRWTVAIEDMDLDDWTVHERLAIASDGTIAIAGPARSDGGAARIVTISGDGQALLDVPLEHHGRKGIRPLALAFGSADALLVGGEWRHGNGPRRVWVQTRSGPELAVAQEIEITDTLDIDLATMAVAQDDDVVLAIDRDGTLDLQRIAATGELEWSVVTTEARADTLAVDLVTGDLVMGGDWPAPRPGISPDVVRDDGTGNRLWALDLQPLVAKAHVDHVATTPVGETILLAGQWPPPADQLGIAALDAEGALTWRHENYELGPADADHELPSMRAVAVDAVGDIVIVGWSSRIDTGAAEPWVGKLDVAGDLRWQASLASPADAMHDFALYVATAADTTIVVAGRAGTDVEELVWVAALEP